MIATLLVLWQATVAPELGTLERAVVVDREPGRYLGHPSTVRLADGHTVLCAYPEGHGRGAIRLRRSSDGGRTWSAPLPVPASFADSRETPTLFRVEAGEKNRLLLFSGLYPIRLAHSEDEGEHWSELVKIGNFGGIVAMSSLLARADGELLAFFHDDGRFLREGGKPGKFQVLVTRSRDGGLSWSEPETIAARDDVDLCEPGLVSALDGKNHVLLLRENARKRNSFALLSSDEGASWSEPRELTPELTGDRHVALTLPDGRVLVSLRDMAHGSPTRGDWVAWLGTFEQLLAGGGRRLALLDNRHDWDCGYAGLERLTDGTFLAVSYGHWREGEEPYVVALSFGLAELERLAR
jgi:hypothetical protein